jgi:hypothetical protein
MLEKVEVYDLELHTAQARMGLRFCKNLDWSFSPNRNFRRTMGAIDALR